jgi:hypothetical protein
MTASVHSDWNHRGAHIPDTRLFLVDLERPDTPIAPVVWDWSLVAVVALVIVVLASIVLI